MPLPDDYLVYPKRAYGMDQDRYDWRFKSPASREAGALSVVIVVPIEHHGLTPSGKPFKHPGAMVTPYPDLRHYTTRDYGNRVGVYRLLKALGERGLKATFPINADQLERLSPLVETIKAGGHEIAAYGLSTDHIHWGGLDPDLEAAWTAEVRSRFASAGLQPRTWMSPARQQSFSTLDLIAAEGFDVTLDWEMDERVTLMRTKAGEVAAVPLSNELDDRTLLIDKRQSEAEWSTQIRAAVTYLSADGHADGRVLGFTLTPYVAGQPFRLLEVEGLLAWLAAEPHVKAVTASQAASLVAQGSQP
jgi:peptidoglycan/xylan/chitin deacetylase (PgdA/CDA1 family)